MERLPDEVVLHVFSFLEFTELVRIQLVSKHHLALARDNALWKIECFNNSLAEARRQRQRLLNGQDPRLAQLRSAVSALPGGDLTALDVSQLRGGIAQSQASYELGNEARTQRLRTFANWEPGYQGENLDYYEEYIHRYAPIRTDWLSSPKTLSSDKEAMTEATGVGTLVDDAGRVDRVVAPLDDGSVCVWDVSMRSTLSPGGVGNILGRSKPGLLTGQAPEAIPQHHSIMTETGAVECVAIDRNVQKGYFAVKNLLQEVDMNTLQLVSTKHYPFSITALSEVEDKVPLTVGTNMTIHLHDPRDAAFGASGSSGAGELIGGSVYSQATLAQPGPLSILHYKGPGPGDSSIWVAGRFTSLLNYDRRFFPRLLSTIHSGARISSLSSLPYPLIPRSLDLVREPQASISALMEARAKPGMTMLAAAEYKGKGSLELYGLPHAHAYQNRQTASASKLLSVAPHGGRIVFSDGNGNLKWFERDGFSLVRTFNLIENRNHSADEPSTTPVGRGIWASTGSEMQGQGDIVQKIIPMDATGSRICQTDLGRADINQSNLLLWTGDGALGVLGFAKGHLLGNGDDDWYDAVESQAVSGEQRAREDAERQYAGAMRRALERNADEVRFVRGLGMGFMRQ